MASKNVEGGRWLKPGWQFFMLTGERVEPLHVWVGLNRCVSSSMEGFEPSCFSGWSGRPSTTPPLAPILKNSIFLAI